MSGKTVERMHVLRLSDSESFTVACALDCWQLALRRATAGDVERAKRIQQVRNLQARLERLRLKKVAR
ncbi:hypothetical protein RA307_31435 [Xanthobacteraceae bacterium Astr-EGSB]|uniref:hypothetical protein n=1 Tax=Astrobacterium formosum TaxID=3069710 RepID=UPI0027ADE1BC|nr:hypothetical protein [Xanthobacteraceae bacterium Astr-EGSB]